MSDPEDERSSQPGEIDATPVGTNEDDVATGADVVSIQLPENVTVRRSSGAAGPTVDSSRSAISSLMPTRGPAEEINEHEKACQNLKVAIDSFYSAHPLSENYSMVFARSCDKPMPPVPPDDELLQFLALDSSEISELDIRTVRLVLRSRMDEYEDMCTAVLDSVKYEKIKSRRSSVGEVNKTLMSDIKMDRQLQEQHNKTLNDMTSGNEISEGQFGALVKFLKYTGRSNWNAIFEFFKSKLFGIVDAKVICGHLDYLFSIAGGAKFGTKLNSEDLSADQPSKNIPMSVRSNVNTKTLTIVLMLICFIRYYCVYADLFRLSYNGRLTAYGKTYQNSVDNDWGKMPLEFAAKHSSFKPSSDKGKKGGGGGNRKIFKSN